MTDDGEHDTLTIRLATRDDLPAVVDIYNHYVLHSTCTFAETPEDAAYWQDWFADSSWASCRGCWSPDLAQRPKQQSGDQHPRHDAQEESANRGPVGCLPVGDDPSTVADQLHRGVQGNRLLKGHEAKHDGQEENAAAHPQDDISAVPEAKPINVKPRRPSRPGTALGFDRNVAVMM